MMFYLKGAQTGKEVDYYWPCWETLDGALSELQRARTCWQQHVNLLDSNGRILYRRSCTDGRIYRWDADSRKWLEVKK